MEVDLPASTLPRTRRAELSESLAVLWQRLECRGDHLGQLSGVLGLGPVHPDEVPHGSATPSSRPSEPEPSRCWRPDPGTRSGMLGRSPTPWRPSAFTWRGSSTAPPESQRSLRRDPQVAILCSHARPASSWPSASASSPPTRPWWPWRRAGRRRATRQGGVRPGARGRLRRALRRVQRDPVRAPPGIFSDELERLGHPGVRALNLGVGGMGAASRRPCSVRSSTRSPRGSPGCSTRSHSSTHSSGTRTFGTLATFTGTIPAPPSMPSMGSRSWTPRPPTSERSTTRTGWDDTTGGSPWRRST